MDLTREELKMAFEAQGYIGEDEIITTTYLALKLGKPLLVEGAPGVGKTEIAKVLSKVFETELIRLQCYEGLDENKALYEWNYQKQLLKIQISKDHGSVNELESDLFSTEYLLERPLLKAISAEKRPVLLIDEIDKTDEQFEAFLFEILSDFQVSIPELGTLEARQIPIVILTSNGERELSDGLKRRCAYLYIDYPSIEKELRILRAKVPGLSEKISREIVRAVHFLRFKLDLKKNPSIAETLDWARALTVLEADRLNAATIRDTVNLILKNKDDKDLFNLQVSPEKLAKIVEYKED